MRKVTLYTDGACIGNPGPGGYGAVLLFGPHAKELFAGFRLTTNNRMEIMAVIAGLRALRYRCAVTVYSDSQYVVYAMAKGWVRRWRSHGWMRTRKDTVVNTDLWQQLLELCEQHDVTFEWIKGHAGQPENERCDRLSMAAASSGVLQEDMGYAAAGTAQAPGPLPEVAGATPAAPEAH